MVGWVVGLVEVLAGADDWTDTGADQVSGTFFVAAAEVVVGVADVGAVIVVEVVL